MTTAAPSAFQDFCTRRDGLPAIPLMLGVVSDAQPRTIRFRPVLAKIYQEFQAAYPHSPIVLQCSLAEGAEQLAAQAAIDGGLFVRAILPTSPEVFRAGAQFPTDAGRQRFDSLLTQTPQVDSLVVPLPQFGNVPAHGWDVAANAGGYLTRRCHALIVISAGKPGEPLGARVKEYVDAKLEGKAFGNLWSPTHALGFRGDRGPVILIFADGTREVRVPKDLKPHDDHGHDHPALFDSLGDVALAGSVNPLRHFWHRIQNSLSQPLGDAELWQFRSICQAVDDFNRDVVNSCKLDDIHKSVQALPGHLPKPELLGEPHARQMVRIGAVRDAAGLVAQELAPRENWAVLSIFCLLAGFLICFHFYAHNPFSHHDAAHDAEHAGWEHPPMFLAAAISFLLLTVPVVIFAWLTRLDERRLDYRALAESLRVRWSWSIGGVGQSVADSYMEQLRGEMIWARLALQHIAPPPRILADQFASLSLDQQIERLKLVQKDWVQGQRDYMHHAHHKQHRLGAKFRNRGITLFAIGLLGLLCLLGIQFTLHHEPTHVTLIVLPMIVIAAGLSVAYGERRSHEELSKQYARMYVVFDDADKELTAALETKDVPRAHAILIKLGHEAISEHAQWLILRRARPVELQLGG